MHYLFTGDPAKLDSLPPFRRRTEESLAAAEAVAYTPAERDFLDRARRGLDHFFAEYDKVAREPGPQGPSRTDLEAHFDTLMHHEILEPTHGYLQLNEDMLVRAEEASRRLAERLVLGLVLFGVCGSVAGLVGGVAFAAAMRRSIRRTEARLRQTERDALRAEQLAWAGQMAAGVAHELLGPLQTVKRLARVAVADLPPAERPALEREIERLELVVGGLHAFTGPPRPDPRPVEVGRALAETADAVRTRAGIQGVALEVVPPVREVVLRADSNQLGQVLLNLLFNALDAQPAGGRVRLAAGVEVVPGGTPTAVILVEDEGPGLPPGVGDRIFEPFVGTKGTGLGLGLSICRRLLDAAGGSISAADRPGRGAAFTVRLPLADLPREPTPPRSGVKLA